jgi:chromate reductase
MKIYQIAVIVGSNRRESINRKLADATGRLAPASLRLAEVRIDDLPMYNADLESSRPSEVTRFTTAVREADAVIVVMPEHNRSLPAVLKSAIDWGSKPLDKNVWKDKPVAIMGTSPGAIGTALGQQHLRQILGVLGSTVMGGEVYVTYKPELINANGDIAVESTREFLTAFLQRFDSLVARLVGAGAS